MMLYADSKRNSKYKVTLSAVNEEAEVSVYNLYFLLSFRLLKALVISARTHAHTFMHFIIEKELKHAMLKNWGG